MNNFYHTALFVYCFLSIVIGSAFCCWLQQVNDVGTFRIHTCSRSRQRAVLLCYQAKTRNKIEEWLSNEKAFVFVSFSFSFISVCSIFSFCMRSAFRSVWINTCHNKTMPVPVSLFPLFQAKCGCLWKLLWSREHIFNKKKNAISISSSPPSWLEFNLWKNRGSLWCHLHLFHWGWRTRPVCPLLRTHLTVKY